MIDRHSYEQVHLKVEPKSFLYEFLNSGGSTALWQELAKASSEDSRHKILYNGVPFIVNGKAIFDCQHGFDKT